MLVRENRLLYLQWFLMRPTVEKTLLQPFWVQDIVFGLWTDIKWIRRVWRSVQQGENNQLKQLLFGNTKTWVIPCYPDHLSLTHPTPATTVLSQQEYILNSLLYNIFICLYSLASLKQVSFIKQALASLHLYAEHIFMNSQISFSIATLKEKLMKAITEMTNKLDLKT